MQGIKISRPRILRANADRPLTLNEIQGAAPAVFQTAAYHAMSPSYAYIPTINVLEAMLERGFTVYEVAQTRPRKGDRDPYAKHMIRMRYPTEGAPKVGDAVPELVLVNAHDGTARYYLYAGLYRFICSNGMVVGDTFAKIVVAHRGGDITRSRVLEGSYELVNDEVPKVMTAVQAMQRRVMKPEEQLALAERAMELRYPNTVASFAAIELLKIRRQADEADSLWHTFNRIQENVLQGGIAARSVLLGRRSTTRPVERVDSLIGINRRLWDAAMAYVES
jgi:hypothetical protein